MISQKKQQLQSAATSRKILSSVFLNPFLFFKLTLFGYNLLLVQLTNPTPTYLAWPVLLMIKV